MTQVYEWFDAAQIESWDKTQDTDHELWHMGMEYKDGTVVTYITEYVCVYGNSGRNQRLKRGI